MVTKNMYTLLQKKGQSTFFFLSK